MEVCTYGGSDATRRRIANDSNRHAGIVCHSDSLRA